MAITPIGINTSQIQQQTTDTTTVKPKHHHHGGHKLQSSTSTSSTQDTFELGNQNNTNQSGLYTNPKLTDPANQTK